MVEFHITVARHLNPMDKAQKKGARVPHALTEWNKPQHSSIAANLLARHQDTRKAIGWEVLQHQPYSDLAPSD